MQQIGSGRESTVYLHPFHPDWFLMDKVQGMNQEKLMELIQVLPEQKRALALKWWDRCLENMKEE
jgi:hypothetical protein